MSARSFAELFKDATVQGVHARTALGNVAAEAQSKQRDFNAAVAERSESEIGDEDDDTGSTEDGESDIVKCSIAKVDGELGLVFGFAIICKKDGQDYFDLQDDHIPERSMLGAATDFMLHSRVAKEMHVGEQDGTVVFAFPLTSEIAKALDIVSKQTGLLIAMKPSAAMLEKFKDGSYTGFSIGGLYGTVVELP